MQKNQSTKYILLDTHKCRACWNCVNKCSKKVIGKINLFFHKHAVIKNPVECTGCLNCLKACSVSAISRNN
ncbi:MAG: ferredoxin family protein [Ignavibacteriales bacterium]|nr:MAG: ferredoxin family protein [Ignavibacteriales bacterium]